MHGHQGNLVVRVILVLQVHVGQQGDVLQKRSEGEDRIFNLGILLRLPFRDEVTEITVPLFLDEMSDTVDEFLDIGSSRLRLDGRVILEKRKQTARIRDVPGQCVGVGGRLPGCQTVDHHAE